MSLPFPEHFRHETNEMSGSITWSPTVKTEERNALQLISTAGGSFPPIPMNVWHLTIRHFAKLVPGERDEEGETWMGHKERLIQKRERNWFSFSKRQCLHCQKTVFFFLFMIRIELFITFCFIWSVVIPCFLVLPLAAQSSQCKMLLKAFFSKSSHLQRALHYVYAIYICDICNHPSLTLLSKCHHKGVLCCKIGR